MSHSRELQVLVFAEVAKDAIAEMLARLRKHVDYLKHHGGTPKREDAFWVRMLESLSKSIPIWLKTEKEDYFLGEEVSLNWPFIITILRYAEKMQERWIRETEAIRKMGHKIDAFTEAKLRMLRAFPNAWKKKAMNRNRSRY